MSPEIYSTSTQLNHTSPKIRHIYNRGFEKQNIIYTHDCYKSEDYTLFGRVEIELGPKLSSNSESIQKLESINIRHIYTQINEFTKIEKIVKNQIALTNVIINDLQTTTAIEKLEINTLSSKFETISRIELNVDDKLFIYLKSPLKTRHEKIALKTYKKQESSSNSVPTLGSEIKFFSILGESTEKPKSLNLNNENEF